YHVAGLAFFPDGKELISVGNDARALRWNLTTGQQSEQQGRTLQAFFAVAVSPNGRRIAITTPRQVSLWDADSMREIARLGGLAGDPRATRFLAGGNTLVVASEEGLRVWRAPSWEEIAAAEANVKTDIK